VGDPSVPVKRVLVTGASGFIGQHLVPALLARGVEVVAASRSRGTGIPPQAEFRPTDLTDARAVEGLAKGCDTVVHLAGLAHMIGIALGDDDFDKLNVDGTRNVLREALGSGVARFVFLSSALVGGNTSPRPLTERDTPRPGDPYARSKARAEQVVSDATAGTGTWAAILRPPMVYGPGNRGNLPRLASLIRRGLPLPFGSVSNARSVLFIDNLVNAVLTLIEQEPTAGAHGVANVFYVADGSPLSTADLAREIGAALGTPARIVAVPKFILMSLARAGDAVATFAPFPFTTRELTKLVGTLVVDDSRLRRATGYASPVTTRDGIRRTFSGAYAAREMALSGTGA